MKNSFLFKTLTLFMLMMIFVSCDTAAEENSDNNQTPLYVGTWKNTYNETYKITETTFSCDSNGYGFEADNLIIDKKTTRAACFICKLQKITNGGPLPIL